MVVQISVVTVCYNTEKSIEQTMLSVLNQTYPNVEYIVIDGGSTDGTVDIIKKYAHLIAYWVSEPDGGIYDAMNKGIAHASGDYILFMNSGDMFYENNTLTNIYPLISQNTDAMFLGDILCIYEGRELGIVHAQKKYSAWSSAPHQGLFLPTQFLKNDCYDCQFKILADRELFLRILHKYNIPSYLLRKVISIYDLGGISSNRKNALQIFQEAYAINKKYGNRPFPVVCKEFFKSIVKYLSRFICSDKLYINIRFNKR